jgi:hypothetical protein
MATASEWGIYVYEQDWLFTEFVGSKAMLASPTLAREWLMQMGTAAANHEMVVQYCMLWPRFALQSLELSAVTTARGSHDYGAGKNDQWQMGLSSLFLDALALRPTKDNFFSTDKQGDGSMGTEHFSRLQGLVSTISTGPVFPSDAVGQSDVGLIMRSCMSDGKVLRPDAASTNLDGNILAKAAARASGAAEPGELQSTTATVGGLVYSYVLAAQTNGTTVVTAKDLFGSATGSRAYVAFESNSSAAPQLFSNTSPLKVSQTDRWSFQFWTVSPVLAGGYAFLGEADSKWIAVSRQRFANVRLNSNPATGFAVDVVGAPGEMVRLGYTTVAASHGPAATTFFACKIGTGGTATATIPEGKCV